MQPGSKSRLAAKTADFPKKLDEDLLRQVFRFRDISGHAQAERIYAAIVALVKLFEGFHIAFGGPLLDLFNRGQPILGLPGGFPVVFGIFVVWFVVGSLSILKVPERRAVR